MIAAHRRPFLLVAALVVVPSALTGCGQSSSGATPTTGATATIDPSASSASSVPTGDATSSAAGTPDVSTSAPAPAGTGTSPAASTQAPVSVPKGATKVTGTHYTVVIPAGWRRMPASESTTENSFTRVSGTRTTGAFLVSVHGADGLDAVKAAKLVAQAFERDGQEPVVIGAPVLLDGVQAVPLTAPAVFDNVPSRVRELVAVHDGKGYEIIYISATAPLDPQLAAESKAILDTFRWVG